MHLCRCVCVCAPRCVCTCAIVQLRAGRNSAQAQQAKKKRPKDDSPQASNKKKDTKGTPGRSMDPLPELVMEEVTDGMEGLES